MERDPHSRGQSLVESLVGVTLVLTLVGMIVAAILQMKKVFKHAYIQSSASGGAEVPDEFLAGKLFSLSRGSPSRNLHDLTELGWQVQSKVKLEDQLIYVLQRQGQQMLFTGRIGVPLCSTADNCLNR